MPRFHCPVPLAIGAQLDLPAAAARHVQVLRLQPGGAITLFNGEGGEYTATVLRMGRSEVAVRIDQHHAIEREPARAVHLAVGMPANDRMDWLVEKATELGVASIQPLHTAHSVLRLSGERATKKQAHWQSVAIAACEQCGGNRVPVVQPVRELDAYLRAVNGCTSDSNQFVACFPRRRRPAIAGSDEWGSRIPANAVPQRTRGRPVCRRRNAGSSGRLHSCNTGRQNLASRDGCTGSIGHGTAIRRMTAFREPS